MLAWSIIRMKRDKYLSSNGAPTVEGANTNFLVALMLEIRDVIASFYI